MSFKDQTMVELNNIVIDHKKTLKLYPIR